MMRALLLRLAYGLVLAGLPSGSGGACAAAETAVATCNIKFLDAMVLPQQGDRAAKLKVVIALLWADVIGRHEIADRAPSEAVFDPDQWILMIDGDGADDQGVGLGWRSLDDQTKERHLTTLAKNDSSL